MRVSSFGGLAHFRADRAPAGAADRCLDCPVAATCPYDAKKIYVAGPNGVESGNKVRGSRGCSRAVMKCQLTFFAQPAPQQSNFLEDSLSPLACAPDALPRH